MLTHREGKKTFKGFRHMLGPMSCTCPAGQLVEFTGGEFYLETSGNRPVEVWLISDMNAFLEYFRETYPTPPSLVKIAINPS